MNLQFKNESVFTIAGPSSSGKTELTKKLVKYRNDLFKKKIGKIHWFYGIVPPFSSMQDVLLHRGLKDKWSDIVKPYDMVIIDDLFVEGSNNKELTNAFTRLAHHKPCTLIYITQNIFHKSTDSKTRNLNTHYLFLMKNPRDATQISYIARQMYPTNAKFLTDVYHDVTQDEPYSYILLDFNQETPSVLRVRSHIFPNEQGYAVYINNSSDK